MRGRGVLRGGRGRPHRPRTGRHDADAEVDRRFYADGSAVAGGEGEPTQESPAVNAAPHDTKKTAKTTSEFTVLRSTLSDAASIADYVRTHHATRLGTAKQLNTFLQAIGNRPDALYAELAQHHKSEVMFVLDRLYAHLSLGKGTTFTPAAHEFVLRCEACGVRRTEWASPAVTPAALPETEPSLFTPRELISRLAACDPVGRVQRMIEMARTVDDLGRCVRKVAHLLARADDAPHPSEGGVHDEAAAARVGRSVSDEDGLSYAARCQLVSKLLSKARRVGADALGGRRTTGEEGAAAQDAHAVTLSAPERDAFAALVTRMLDVVHTVLNTRPASTTQQPIAKCAHFARWCAAHGLITEDDRARVTALETQARHDLHTQASQLEAVMQLKALQQDGDVDALAAALEALWRAGDGTHFAPCSADVLSAVATAAAVERVPPSLKARVAERLVQTQRARGVELPRRALKFVHTVRNAQRAALSASAAPEANEAS